MFYVRVTGLQMRLSLTERPVGPDQRDRRGVPEGYQFSKTEDYYIVGQQPLPTPTLSTGATTHGDAHRRLSATPVPYAWGRRPLYLPLVLKDRPGGADQDVKERGAACRAAPHTGAART